jgi:zinc transport system substrate-binding protein
MKKKFGIEFTEEVNGRIKKYTIYADSVSEAMDYINLSKKDKKASVKIIDNDNKLIHKEEHHNHNHNNNHNNNHNHNEHHGHEHHEDDDDYMYA